MHIGVALFKLDDDSAELDFEYFQSQKLLTGTIYSTT